METQTAGILAVKSSPGQSPVKPISGGRDPADLPLTSPDPDLPSGNFTRVGSGRKLPNLPAEKSAKPAEPNTSSKPSTTVLNQPNNNQEPNQLLQPYFSSKSNQIQETEKEEEKAKQEKEKSKPAALR